MEQFRHDHFRFDALVNFAKDPIQKGFLRPACVRWFINQQDSKVRPRVVVEDIAFYNSNNPKNPIDLDGLLALEKELDAKMLGQSPSARVIKGALNLHNYNPPMAKITPAQHERLIRLYYGNKKSSVAKKSPEKAEALFLRARERDIELLLRIYDMVGNNNTQLSMPPIFEGIECFGSPLNTHNDEYCSPFAIERKFGSLGSFFDYVAKLRRTSRKVHTRRERPEKILLCNPPFDEDFMIKMAEALVDLIRARPKTTVVLTLPVWDPETQTKLGIKSYGKRFECLEILQASGLIADHEVLDKDTYKYYDYYRDAYVAVSYTHLIQLKPLAGFTGEVSLADIKKAWARAANGDQ